MDLNFWASEIEILEDSSGIPLYSGIRNPHKSRTRGNYVERLSQIFEK